MKKIAVLAAMAGFAAVSAADIELQMDVDFSRGAMTSAAAAAGGDGILQTSEVLGYTGDIVFTTDGNTALVAVAIDPPGGVAPGFTAGSLSTFSMTVSFVGGSVTGGSVSVTTIGGGAFSSGVGTGGSIAAKVGGGFTIDGLLTGAAFTATEPGTKFAGADVTAFLGPLSGDFINLDFEPRLSGASLGVDTNSDIDLFVSIPLPAGGAMALAGLGLVGSIRRRGF